MQGLFKKGKYLKTGISYLRSIQNRFQKAITKVNSNFNPN